MKSICFFIGLTAVSALGQIGTSSITGRVTDTRAGVPNCAVQPSTNFTFNTVSNYWRDLPRAGTAAGQLPDQL